MKSLTAKEMATVGNYYYLREGDFFPCRVDANRKLRNDCFTLGLLKAAGALFEKEEDAINASNAIRAFLLGNQMSRQSTQQPRRTQGKSLKSRVVYWKRLLLA